MAHSKQGTSNPQTTYDHYDNDEGKDQEDPDYQNISTTEDIYCNQSYIKAKRWTACISVIKPCTRLGHTCTQMILFNNWPKYIHVVQPSHCQTEN